VKRRVGCLVLALLAIVPTGAAAKRRDPRADRIWIHPRIDGLRPSRIAILPAVSFVWLPSERTFLEDAWLQRLTGSQHVWLPAVLCRERMAATSRRGDSLLNVIGTQIRSRGRVDSTTSMRLARLLDSQALLCLRIDRWERIGGVAASLVYVDMTATLVDSTGRLLWRITSEERLQSVYRIPKLRPGEEVAQAPIVPPGPQGSSAGAYYRWRVSNERFEERLSVGRPGEVGWAMQTAGISPDFQLALSRILVRWARMFPQSPRVRVATAAG
jgi:hypothetical protein